MSGDPIRVDAIVADDVAALLRAARAVGSYDTAKAARS